MRHLFFYPIFDKRYLHFVAECSRETQVSGFVSSRSEKGKQACLTVRINGYFRAQIIFGN
ncbi:hypothetical protein KL86DES1_20472 [uncultured Desulfovibrio sp.]|uniref:Uncharacterized protein n=1 Tax=uncultured Desulfovibrio sp. TaxID=167968 RepID=A0A212L3R9_9BACT|nr:hypothetical protein KL86DES1_20472 [uncultured Desulfovibrio sp.]VZH33375.1 conserved protein of unknown function [Desulfovibrio sp. 86]